MINKNLNHNFIPVAVLLWAAFLFAQDIQLFLDFVNLHQEHFQSLLLSQPGKCQEPESSPFKINKISVTLKQVYQRKKKSNTTIVFTVLRDSLVKKLSYFAHPGATARGISSCCNSTTTKDNSSWLCQPMHLPPRAHTARRCRTSSYSYYILSLPLTRELCYSSSPSG